MNLLPVLNKIVFQTTSKQIIDETMIRKSMVSFFAVALASRQKADTMNLHPKWSQ